MADNEIIKIEDKLNEILVFLARLEEKHNSIHERVDKLEMAISPLKSHANRVEFSVKLFLVLVGLFGTCWKIFSK
jgi:heme oxygenase